MPIVALALAALVQSAAPAPTHSFDLNSKLINNPAAEWIVYGPDQTSKLLPTGGPQNYPAYEVIVTKAGRNAWDDGAVSVIPKPINAGDVILIALYIREPGLGDGQTETLPLIGATGATAPYVGIAGAPAAITNQWKLYFASGKAAQAFPAGGAQVTVHLASAPHKIEVGPARVYDMGPDFDMSRLPH